MSRYGIKVLELHSVSHSYKMKGLMFLLMMFMHRSLLEAILCWNSPLLPWSRYGTIFTVDNMYKYVCLEIST